MESGFHSDVITLHTYINNRTSNLLEMKTTPYFLNTGSHTVSSVG